MSTIQQLAAFSRMKMVVDYAVHVVVGVCACLSLAVVPACFGMPMWLSSKKGKIGK